MTRPFADAVHCLSGTHCAACRDPGDRGRAFRLRLASDGWTLPDGAPDFACPHGKAWGTNDTDPVDIAERELLAAAANPDGWGDHAAALIHKVGADRVWKLIRGGSGCGGCNARRKALNRLEEWVKSALSSEPTSRQPPTPPRP